MFPKIKFLSGHLSLSSFFCNLAMNWNLMSIDFMNDHNKFMRLAISLANENIMRGGGPFGAVVVKDGEIVGKGANQVTNHNDPTAHAEILAIRDASRNLNSFDLSSCELYTSCEPCPMCLGAIYWARLKRVFFGNSRDDAASIGFDDALIYREINLPLVQRGIPMEPLLGHEALVTFKTWEQMPGKIEY